MTDPKWVEDMDVLVRWQGLCEDISGIWNAGYVVQFDVPGRHFVPSIVVVHVNVLSVTVPDIVFQKKDKWLIVRE